MVTHLYRPQCKSCGKRPRSLVMDYCATSCYHRWIKAGRPASGPPPTALELWRNVPPVDPGRKPNAMDLGAAGEHLVCADLLLNGFVAFRTEQGSVYDVAVDFGGRLIRLQVKATKAATVSRGRVLAYEWRVQRNGNSGRGKYAADDFDLLALVALDLRLVAYALPSLNRGLARIQPPGSATGKRFEDYPFGRALAQIVSIPEGGWTNPSPALFDVPEQAIVAARYEHQDGEEMA